MCRDAAALETISYPTHVHSLADTAFEFDVIETVMESVPGACDAFSGNFCCDLSAGTHKVSKVDATIVATVNGFLHACAESSGVCHALDIGGNMGTITKYMLSTGATVTTIEPQVSTHVVS
jgi:hypothetical protein